MVNELGEVRSATLPFTLFENLSRECRWEILVSEVYARSDDVLHLKKLACRCGW